MNPVQADVVEAEGATHRTVQRVHFQAGHFEPAALSPMLALIRAEQAADANFIRPPLDPYLEKIAARADFLAETGPDGCRALVAYYCNDRSTLTAYVTLMLVAPQHRRSGLGRIVLGAMLDHVRTLGFLFCRLEVRSENQHAIAFYRKLGFEAIKADNGNLTMECPL